MPPVGLGTFVLAHRSSHPFARIGRKDGAPIAGGAQRSCPAAKVACSGYSNIFASSDTLFARGATTGFPYNCALRRTARTTTGGADEVPCSHDDVAVRSKRADRSCRRYPRNDKTLELQYFRHPYCLWMKAQGCERVRTKCGLTVVAAFSYRPFYRKKQS
jgi:hypothetical protein